MLVTTRLFLLPLLLSSVGRICSGEIDCNCPDNSKGCLEKCVSHNVRRDRLLCTSTVLPDICNYSPTSNDSYCDDELPFIGAPSVIDSSCPGPDDACYWRSCCFVAHCPVPNNYTAPSYGNIARAQNVQLSWHFYQKYVLQLWITWSQPTIDSGSGLLILISTATSTDYTSFTTHLYRCTCLSESVVSYSVLVGQAYGRQVQVKLVSLPIGNIDIFDDDTTTVTILEKVPVDCWELEGANIDNCGPRTPSAPLNLIIDARQVNDTSAMLQMKWEQPLYFAPNILAYMISIDYFDYIYYTSQTELSVIVRYSTSYEVQVYASNTQQQTKNNEVCATVSEGCGVDYDISCGYYCWGDYAYASVNVSEIQPTASKSPSKSSSKKRTILIAGLTGGGLLLLFGTITTILLAVYRGHFHKKSSSMYISMRDDCSLTPPVSSVKVFIINSPESTELDLQLVRNLCHNLADHSIETVAYEYAMFQHGPDQSGIFQWTEDKFTDSDMILFVCNKSFFDAWNGSSESDDAFVSASRQLLQGHLTSKKDISKLAVVLLREHDQQYIPSLYLKNLSMFVLFHNGECNEEELVRYILQLPRFIRPQVKDVNSVVTHVLTEKTV